MTTLDYLRQFRLSGYAIFDLLAAFIGLYLLAPILSKIFLKLRISIPKENWVILTLPISILTHLLVGNITSMTSDFLHLNGHYLLKIIVLVSLFFGLQGIKIVKRVQR